MTSVLDGVVNANLWHFYDRKSESALVYMRLVGLGAGLDGYGKLQVQRVSNPRLSSPQRSLYVYRAKTDIVYSPHTVALYRGWR